MNVNLTPELEDLVQRKIDSGLYRSRSEVVREALRLMAEHDRQQDLHRQYLRKALEEGVAQADRGELRDGRQVFEEARRRIQGDVEDDG